MNYKCGKFKVNLTYLGEIEEYVYAESQEDAIQIIKSKIEKLDNNTFIKLLNLKIIQEKCNWNGQVLNNNKDIQTFNDGCFK